MRIAVTGASGNAGSALLRRLGDEPEVTAVVGVSRRRPPADRPPFAGVEWVIADVASPRSVRDLTAAFTEVDAVIHLAWLIQPSHDEAARRRTNVDLTWRARRQPTGPGWIDLAAHSPVMSSRAIHGLGWTPEHSAPDALGELIEGLRAGAGASGPPLVARHPLSNRTPDAPRPGADRLTATGG